MPNLYLKIAIPNFPEQYALKVVINEINIPKNSVFLYNFLYIKK